MPNSTNLITSFYIGATDKIAKLGNEVKNYGGKTVLLRLFC